MHDLPQLPHWIAFLLFCVSMVPLAFVVDRVSIWRSNGAGFAFRPLIANRTVYVSTTGSDTTGDGTVTRPWATIARAWADRQSYGTLNARYMVQLVGAGPYTMLHLLNSQCGDGGHFIMRGDPAAETIHITGTFTGAFSAALVVNTSAGLGVNTQLGRFVRVTSGAAIGCTFQVVQNTDTSITTANNSFGIALANGDAFQIFSPGTAIENAAYTSKLENLTGGDSPSGVGTSSLNLAHIFYDIRFTKAPTVRNSQVGFVNCKVDTAGIGFAQGAQIGTYLADATVLDLPAGALRSGALWCVTAMSASAGAFVYGIIYHEATLTLLSGAIMQAEGGRFAAIALSQNAILFLRAEPTAGFRWHGEITVRSGALCDGQTVVSVPFAVWAVTGGSCLRARDGGLIRWAIACTGGTSDAAGFGASTVNGGRIYFSGAPTATGGTPGADLRTTATAGPTANAALGAAPSTVDALGSPYAESLSRVS